MKKCISSSFGILLLLNSFSALSFAQSAEISALPSPTPFPTPTPLPPLTQASAVSPELKFLIKGRLRERGTRQAMGGVNVFVLPHKLKGTTNAKGEFEILNVPEGEFQIVVNFSGYKRYEKNYKRKEGNQAAELNLFLERESYQEYETTIYGKQNKKDDSVKSLTQKQFLNMVGANGDPVKALQNLPGVNRVNAFSSQVIIQGSGPQDTKYTIDGHEVPIIFHFGGFSSVVFPNAIERVDLLQAGYGPEFSRAMGGLVNLWTKKPETDRVHGMAFVDLVNAGGMIEAPINDHSRFLISGRTSYIGYVLGAVTKNNPNFNLTVAPTFSDVTAIYENQITKRDEFRIVTVGSSDSLSFLLKQPSSQDPAIRGQFNTTTQFFRIIPQITHKHSDRTTSRFSLGFGRDYIFLNNADNNLSITTKVLTTRGEVERQMTDIWKTFVGFDNRYTYADVNINLPSTNTQGGVSTPLSAGASSRQSVNLTNQKSIVIGLFNRNEIKFANSPWTLFPNLRFDYFGLTKEATFGPRPAARYAIDDTFFLKAATGLYYQPPQEQQVNATFGNPDLKSSRAYHATIGFEKDFRGGSSSGFIASSDLFYRYFDQLAITSTKTVIRNGVPTAELYNNNGRGTAYGIQSSIRLEKAPWSANILYTLSLSRRWDNINDPYPYAYDQTHLLGVLGSYATGNWVFSSRFRYSTGNPFTPIAGSTYSADADVYIPIRGAFYSDRFDPFMQVDFRIDRKFVYDTFILSAYLDIQNVTNRMNPQQYVYNYDYTQRSVVSGLPILPILGVKGEF